MKIGVIFPQHELGGDMVMLRDYVQTAEELGYDFLELSDFSCGINAECPGRDMGTFINRNGVYDPFVLFGYLAALTPRMEWVTGVSHFPSKAELRMLPGEGGLVSLLTGGRLRLWAHTGDLTSLNDQPHKTQAQIEKDLHHIRSTRLHLWGHTGNFIPLSDQSIPIEKELLKNRMLLEPPLFMIEMMGVAIQSDGSVYPPIPPPIPLWFNADGNMLPIAARLGDGAFLSSALFPGIQMRPYSELQTEVDKLHASLYESGRGADTFGLEMRLYTGSIPQAQWGAVASDFAALGVTHLCLSARESGLSTLDEHLELLRHFKAEVR